MNPRVVLEQLPHYSKGHKQIPFTYIKLRSNAIFNTLFPVLAVFENGLELTLVQLR